MASERRANAGAGKRGDAHHNADDGSRPLRKWVDHGLSNPTVYGALLHGGTRLPLPILRAISTVGNAIAVRVLRGTVRDMASNFQTALGLPRGAALRLARDVFRQYGLTTVDLWRLRSGAPELAPKMTTLAHDAAVLRGLARNGRGFLLASAHVGNWEMGAAAIRAVGLPAAVVGQPELDPAVHAMRLRVRERLGVESIDIGSTIATALRVREAVDRGRVVALAVDRAYAEDSVLVPFFGRPTPFLRSPALLARFCGCPLLPCFFLRNADGTYRGVLGAPLEADSGLSPDADATRLMAEVARDVEAVVRAEPAQWFNFYRFWE
ncbi:MAG TPA: lysophospholipid acyltransferase family protein [Thermoanaerobaculia bacterium]|nr:lysophospholipid acyltransferase family protein [Thermoanaerobaculia bacterium]